MNKNEYPHVTRIEVTFRDLDVLGHVNNAVYLSYLETARIKYMMSLLEVTDIARLPLILAEVTISYQSPAAFGEVLLVGSRVGRLGNKSFDVEHRIETENGRLITTAKTILVMYDYNSRRTVPLPDTFRRRVAKVQEP